MDSKITFFAEFQNKELENDFFINEVQKSLRYIRYVLLTFSAVNFLLVIYDYFLLDAGGLTNIILFSLIPRSGILLFSIIFFFVTSSLKRYRFMLHIVSLFIPLFYALHLFMAYHFVSIDLTTEALDVILVVLCIFLVPNRWIISLSLSVVTASLFYIVSPIIFPVLTPAVIIGVMIYFLWIILIIGILVLRINRYKRLQYFKELQLEMLAETDPLTKCYNRLKCDNTLTQLCQNELCFSTILFDIDNFKEINDTYGHIVGDKVLVEIVEITLKNIRGIDILARWGGDEFLIILYGASLQSAITLAERLRQHIEDQKIENAPCTITASFGTTEYLKGDTLYSIIDRVDKQLYSAKENGKNRIISA